MKHTERPWQRLVASLRRRLAGERDPRASDATASTGHGLRDELLEVIHDIETAYRSEGKEGCLCTGFPGFDRLTGGARPGELLVIASAPGMGKTVLALNIAAEVALSGSGTVAIFSLESSRREMTQRLLCSLSGVSLNRVRSGGLLAGRDFPRLQEAAAQLAGASILLEDSAAPRLSDLRDRLRELKAIHDVKLVVIDSFQLLCGASGDGEEALQVARELKRWARESGVVILAVAQLDSPPANRKWGRPVPADLNACRAVEQHADVVALLWRQDYFDAKPEDYDPDFSQASLILVKNRHGAVGEVPLLFRKEVPRFENRALEKAQR